LIRTRLLPSLLICATACFITAGTLLAVFHSEASPKPSQRTLTFAERVTYQRAIEEVYWRHRIWPKETSTPKPALDAVMTQAQLEKKVADYLRKSQALEDYWQRAITSEQLQAEMDRMVKHTRQPEVLRELFEALGNDPFVIAECLARPALAERLLTDWYAFDERIHGDLKRQAAIELRAHPTAEQMKLTTGTYTDLKLVKTNSREAQRKRGLEHALNVDPNEWDKQIQQLAAIFCPGGNGGARRGVGNSQLAGTSVIMAKPRQDGSLDTGAQLTQIKTGVLSPLQEDRDHFYATLIIEKTRDYVRVATVRWAKEPLESWLTRVINQVPIVTAPSNVDYTLPEISDQGCDDDTWAASSMNVPFGTWNHTAVWTGSEMIVWGGENNAFIFGTGGRYDPSTDTWTATSLNNNPSPRTSHTAVWTGSEMIVWGGLDGFGDVNTGGRYNRSTNSWTATSTAIAPSGRYFHTEVWTGTEMIVWGGYSFSLDSELNTGGRYNPSTNTWVTTSVANAPTARHFHTAVWTGSDMIVWGGYDFGNDIYYNTGGKYNPSTNTWEATATINAPTARSEHTAIWTGTEMIVWGGWKVVSYFNTGSRYSPSTNTWATTSTTNAPLARYDHTAVWTSGDMIVWGGATQDQSYVNTGARYHPATNTWTETSTTNAPYRRWLHTALWTGAEMIVWGGRGDEASSYGLTTGGRYDPSTDTWVTTNGNAPSARWYHTAIWTGSEMIVWGGNFPVVLNTGGRYDPSTDTWMATSTTNAPAGRSEHTAVWSGTEMIIWGGSDGTLYLNTGGRYDPTTDGWTATSTVNAPSARLVHTAVWTGTEMIIWGGFDGSHVNSGGRYDPNTNVWTATNTTNAPQARDYHTAIWTGTEMIVWGGFDNFTYFNTGGKYTPSTNSWVATSTANAPTARDAHTAVWTGSEMLVWGGYFNDGTEQWLDTGGRYSPSSNTWVATNVVNAPTARSIHSAVWTGSEMIVWGGNNGDIGFPYDLNSGGRYNPSANSWTPTSLLNAPCIRRLPTSVWTGSEMIVWGGFSYVAVGAVDTGGRYCASSNPPPTPSPTPTPTPCTGRCEPTPRPRPTPAPRPTP